MFHCIVQPARFTVGCGVHVSCLLLTMTTSSILVTLLLQELARLLAEPLRPGFSQKYFTGGAAGAAAMLLSSGGAAAGPDAKPGDVKVQCHHQQQQQGQLLARGQMCGCCWCATDAKASGC